MNLRLRFLVLFALLAGMGLYMALHLDHHRAILGVRRTALLALSRLLHRRVSGRLKLH